MLLSQAIAAVQEYLQIFSFIRAVSDQKSKCFMLEGQRSVAGNNIESKQARRRLNEPPA
jgi:hypothetical protein